MDPENGSQLVLGCLIIIVTAVIGIIWPQAYWAMSSWRYRNADAMEPTEGQYRVHRARYAALLSLGVPPLIGLAWPGDFTTKLQAGMISAVASVGIIVAVLVIISVVRRKSRESTIDHERPSELSDAGYGVEWFGVVYTFIYVLVIVVIFAGMQSSLENRRQEALDKANHTMTPAEKAELQQLIDRITDSYPKPVPPTYVDTPGLAVYTAVPDGLYVGGVVRTQTNDAGEMRLLSPDNVCPLVGVIVIESSVNVSIGFAFDASAAATADPATFCVKKPGSTVNTLPLPVTRGDRVLLTLTGEKITGGAY